MCPLKRNVRSTINPKRSQQATNLMSHRPQRKRNNTHRHTEQQQNKFHVSDANKKSDLCLKRTKKISDEDKFDDSDATNKKSDVCLKETKKDIDISGTHVVV